METTNPEIRRGAPGLYPWREWLDGKYHTVVRGVDFHSDLAGFRNAVYSAAVRRGFKAQASIDYDRGTVTFRAVRAPKGGAAA